MKKIKFIFLLLVVILVGFVKVSAFTPLDEILQYHIYVDPTEEGNLNMRYHIKWRVLERNGNNAYKAYLYFFFHNAWVF